LLLKLWKQLRLGELTGDEIDQTLEDYCVCMVDPATGGTSNEAGQLLEETPLCTNGDAIPVTSGNLGDFFQLLAHSWFGEVGNLLSLCVDSVVFLSVACLCARGLRGRWPPSARLSDKCCRLKSC
jgi:hypothetical protein